MPRTRKNHPPSLKAKVARADQSPKDHVPNRPDVCRPSDAEKDELYKQIGQLKVELDFLKKRAGLNHLKNADYGSIRDIPI